MATILLYVLEIHANGLASDVRLNGVQVFHEEKGVSKVTQLKANPWIVAGINRLEVLLALLPPPAGQEATEKPGFSLSFLQGEHGKEPGDEGRLCSYVWNPAETPLRPGAPASVWKHEVKLTETFSRWSWESAPTAPLNDADRAALVAALDSLHDALARRDPDRVAVALRLKHAEMARALGIPEARPEEGLRKQLAILFGQSSWRMSPLQPDRLRFLPQADNRLVAVTDSTGGPPLVGSTDSGDSGSYRLTPVYTRVDGKWVIVR